MEYKYVIFEKTKLLTKCYSTNLNLNFIFFILLNWKLILLIVTTNIIINYTGKNNDTCLTEILY